MWTDAADTCPGRGARPLSALAHGSCRRPALNVRGAGALPAATAGRARAGTLTHRGMIGRCHAGLSRSMDCLAPGPVRVGAGAGAGARARGRPPFMGTPRSGAGGGSRGWALGPDAPRPPPSRPPRLFPNPRPSPAPRPLPAPNRPRFHAATLVALCHSMPG